MSYGSPEWQGWVLGEEEALKHIKYAYDQGIQTFDTANVRVSSNELCKVNLIGGFLGILERPLRGHPWQSDQAI